jgi:hypothetical protein
LVIQKTKKETSPFNDTIHQMVLTDSCRVIYLATIQYTFFSAAPGIFSEIYHILGHKASLSRYNTIKIIFCILSDHNARKAETNSKRKYRKCSNTWILNNTLMNDQWAIEEIRGNQKVPRS